jgi:hypothetical protein
MGAKQSLEEADAPTTPRSPSSPRVLPVDGGETSNTAQLQLDSSRGDEALSPKSDEEGYDIFDDDDEYVVEETDRENDRALVLRTISTRSWCGSYWWDLSSW